MNRVRGKVAIVTGAASGMGRAHAEMLADQGATVVVTDRDEGAGAKTVNGIRESGGKAIFCPHDVSSEADWKRIVMMAIAEYGRVSVLVNNAGIAMFKPTTDTTLDEWDMVQNVNARGTFLGCREIIPIMKIGGGGSIINVSSTFGLVGRSGFAAYSASKGAVRAMTKSLAAELAADNIRVNSICPGTIETNLTKPILTSPAAIEAAIGAQLIRRPGQPAEVAAAVLFLASDESSFITGTEMIVDGGYVAV